MANDGQKSQEKKIITTLSKTREALKIMSPLICLSDFIFESNNAHLHFFHQLEYTIQYLEKTIFYIYLLIKDFIINF